MKRNRISEATGSGNAGNFKVPIVLSPQPWTEDQVAPFTNPVYSYNNAELAYEEADGDFKETPEERARIEEQRLADKFQLETTQVRTLEELILQLENGLNEFTQHDLKDLLAGVENRLSGLALATSDSLSLEYLLNRLNRGISQARTRVPR